MTDIAALGLKIEGVQSIDQAAASLENLASAGKKTEAAAKGVSTGARAIKPAAEDAARATDKLTDAEKRLAAQAERAGMSVKQMQFALRGLPAQFTDIAVSLQGGQKPLTVFLQQGGQLKDMFGGAGLAARAMASYVVGLINPLSVAAAALTALGTAYYQGSKEADNFRRSLATTGNAAGETVSSLSAYAKQISSVTGTQAKAAEALTDFVAAGVRAENNLAKFTLTAIQWEKATGEGVDKVAEKFKALEKDPLNASVKLNESMNFLTVETYSQIKALEEQGNATDAAAVAMSALDSAMAERAKNISDNLGSIERAWNAVSGAAKGAWGWMLNVGRQASLSERLAQEQEKLLKLETDIVGVYEKGTHAKHLSIQRERVQALMDEYAQSELAAASTRKQAQEVDALSGFHKQYAKQLKEELPLAQQLAKARADGAAAGASEAEITQIVNKLTEDYNKKHKTRTESTKSLENSYRTLAERANEYIKSLTLEAQQGEKVSRSQQLQIELDTLLARGKGKGTDALAARTKALIAEAKAMETSAKASKAMAEAAEQHTKEQQELDDYLAKQADAIGKQAKASADANKALENETKLLDLQASLIGASTEERERAIEQMRIQIALEKDLAALDDDKALTSTARDSEKEKARTRAVQKSANAEKKIRIESANEINKYIEDGLYDSIVTGGASAKEALERMFKNLVLRPIVQAAVGSLFGGDSGSGSSGGIGGALSSGQSLYSALSGGLTSSVATGIGSIGSAIGSTVVSEFAAGMIGGAQMAAPVGMGIGSMGAAASGGAMGMGATFAAALPWVGGALAVASLLGGMDFSGETRNALTANISNGTLSEVEHWKGEEGSFAKSAVHGAVMGAYTGVNDLLASLGSSTRISEIWSAMETSERGRGGTFFGGQLSNGESFGSPTWYQGMYTQSLDFDQALQQYQGQMSAAFIEALQKATDLPNFAQVILGNAQGMEGLTAAIQQIMKVKAAIEQLGQSMAVFSGASDEMISSLMYNLGGIEGVTSSANALYSRFYSEQERMDALNKQLQDAFGSRGLALDTGGGDASKAKFRELLDELKAIGAYDNVSMLLSLADSFAIASDYAQKGLDSLASGAANLADHAEDAANRLSQAWSNVQSASSLGATYTGNTSGLETQLAILRASASSSTDTADRLAAAQQIAQIEQELWNADQDNRNAAAKAAQQQEQALREQLSTVNALANAARGLRNFVEDLRTSELSGLTEAQRLSGLDSNYQKQLALANSGDVNAFSDLQSTTRDFLSLSSQNATTQAEFNALSARTAAELEAAAVIQEASATTEQLILEQQIASAQAAQEIAQQQFKVSNSTKELIDALLAESMLSFAKEQEQAFALIKQGDTTNYLIAGLPAGIGSVLSATLVPAIQGLAASYSAMAEAQASANAVANIPKYAVGTPYVPETGLALIHKGEAIIPAQYNPAANGGDMRVSASSSEDARMQNAAVIAVLNRVFRIIDEWNVDGLPHKREEYTT